MRRRLLFLTTLVVVLAACGGGSLGTASSASQAPAGQASPGRQPESTPAAGNPTVDCAKITAAAQQLLMLQLLAQLRTPESVEQIRTKQVGNLDLDGFLAAMHDLHALDSFASPLGDPKAAIDFYEGVGAAAQVLVATDPVTPAAIDTYNQEVGTVAELLGHQIAISGAIDAAGC